MSVFAGTTATVLKIPAEKGLWSHVQYLRELLDTGVLSGLWWLDTRDMHSDGLTKGTVDRKALQDIMGGRVVYKQTAQQWRPKKVQFRPELEDAEPEVKNFTLNL